MKLDNYKYKRVIIPDIVKVYSNTPKIAYYSFGEFFEKSLLKSETHHLKIIFEVKPVKHFQAFFEKKLNNYTRYSDCVYLKQNGEEIEILYRKRIYPFGNLFMHIFLTDDEIFVYVNKFYNALFKLRIENVLPPGTHLTYLTYLNLVLKNFLPLHAASFALDENEGFLVMAPPNTGKSLTVMKAIGDGFSYLSEDISVVNMKNLNIHAVPHTSTFLHETAAKKRLGLLNYFAPASVNFEKLFSPFITRGIPVSKLKKIFILEPSDKIEITKNECKLSNISNLNKNEFNYRSDIVINALLYSLNLNLEAIEHSNFSDITKKVDVVTIKANSPFAYFDLIKQELEL